MTQFGPSIEPITFPTPSRYATCNATDAGQPLKRFSQIAFSSVFFFIAYLFLNSWNNLAHQMSYAQQQNTILDFYNIFNRLIGNIVWPFKK